ncbi:hypothetical protein [Lactococcus protaetiae]|uniref:Lipoprotein n=1 Tax=Lactococcus protaetiae TaxID=2592653 RepID=A0A514Z820_9LACT|nr:hypothetical protein [Lactococcus protaetiae]QDK70725.1 hypothetical protein FLP15_05615 [Lactococcus protaetiae]
MIKYQKIFGLFSLLLTLISLTACSFKSQSSLLVQQKLTFSPVSTQLSQTIHQDFQKLFGMSACGIKGATLGECFLEFWKVSNPLSIVMIIS